MNGAEDETRTRTVYTTRPSNVRGYQLRHLGLGNEFNKQLIDLLMIVTGEIIPSPFYLLVAVFVLVFKVLAFTSVFTVFVFVSTAAFALALTSTFEFASGAITGTSSAGASGLVVNTEIFPVKAGIAKNNADNIKVVAAIIVIFDKIVCEPRG